MLLEDVKTVNDNNFFDLTNNKYLMVDICKPNYYDNYTPTKLYRTLLYQMKWIYPYYMTENGVNIIKQIELMNNNINDSEITFENNKITMPYNLTYSIYPRIMFNDEEQINIILMLRRPSIIRENQYQMTEDNLNLTGVNQIQELTDPINVMN